MRDAGGTGLRADRHGRVKGVRGVAAALAWLCVPAAAPAQDATPNLPWMRAAFTAPPDLEQAFLAVPSAASAARGAEWLTRDLHVSGTPQIRELADSLAAVLRTLGFEVTLERFEPYLPHPRSIRLRLVGPQPRELEMRERIPAGTAESDSPFLAAWNAYSSSDSVEAPVVYVNYGLPEDYAALRAIGVDVRGKVVLARYGRAYRGVKARVAEEYGALALVLYSDPAGDGYVAGDTIPLGPYRPAGAVQRGSVVYLWRYPGDPLTPGTPAVAGVPRLEPADAPSLPTIPVAPLGYGEAERILRALGGPVVPEGFQGGLPLTYHVGPGPAVLAVEVDLAVAPRPIWNVIARLPGSERQQVILGNHYDAWVRGGVDPHSGTAVMLEIARGLAALRRTGWTPRREIVLAFWDAEEFGVVGSTEWVERHVDELRSRAVAYFNIDVFTAGVLDVAGSASLRDLVWAAARDVIDPVTGESLAEAWLQRQHGAWAARWKGTPAEERDPFEPTLGDLGAGSDWTAFFHFAGVPSLQWTMNGRGVYAVYHSALDRFDYLQAHADSALLHAPALARVMGLAALRLAEAEALPFQSSHYAERVARHLDALERDNLDADGLPRLPLDLRKVRAALADFHAAALALEREQADAVRDGDRETLKRVNRRLPRVERALLDDEGLPGRPWYRHVLYAPGRDTGYEAITLPAATEAIQAADPAALEAALGRVEGALRRAAQVLRREGTG